MGGRREPGAGRWVGIDLGTTFSAVASVDAFGRALVLPNRDGERTTPSVVFFDGEQPLVGTMARRSVATSPLDAVRFVKRAMGDPAWRFETSRGTGYGPEEISALILKRLKEDAERALSSEVTDAVITVPAYFDDAARRATIAAGTIAGLTVRRVVNEPTAAALAAGLVTDPGVGGGVDAGGWAGSLLVYDLGGGTFDVTALRVDPGAVHVLATAGDRNLGGFDFDNALMHLLDERFRAAGGPSLLADDATEVDLRERAELVKHTLTSVEKAVAHLAADGVTRSVTVTRDDFEHLTSALLSRTRDTAEQVVEEAGLTWAKVDRIVLAGGSTRMPMVRRTLTEISGRAPDATANPDEVVALGAARMAHLLEQAERPPEPEPKTHGRSSGLRSTRARFAFRRRERGEDSVQTTTGPAGTTGIRLAVHDVTSHGLGEILFERDTDVLFNRVIIPRNTPIPAEDVAVSYTRYERQRVLGIRITEGDDTDPAHVRILGKEPIRVPPYPKGAPFETTLSYDANQIIFVRIRDLTTGELVGTFEIEHVLNPNAERVVASTDRIRAISPL